MGIKLVVLVRADTSRNVVEHSGRNDSLCVRKSSIVSVRLQRLGCIGAVDRFRCWRQGNGVRERNEDQGKGDETPSVVADVVELEIVGLE